MTQILALDPANHTGWAIGSARPSLFGVWDLLCMGPHRLAFLYKQLGDVISAHGIELIAFEDASFGSPNHAVQAMHNELRGVIRLVAEQRHIEARGFHPTAIKKFATGSGRAKKPQMVRACKTLLGVEADDDNVADACFILALAAADRRIPNVSAKPKRRGQAKAKSPQQRLFR